MLGAVLVIISVGVLLYKPQLRSRIDVEVIRGMIRGDYRNYPVPPGCS